MKHHNYSKQFMIKLFRNNLYFKNITSKFADTCIQCNSCKLANEDRIIFLSAILIKKLFKNFSHASPILKSLKKTNIEPFLYNTTLTINHPTNLIFISVIKFLFNL